MDTWNPIMADLSWSDVAEALTECTLVVIPVGSIEQHGHHLPLKTDTMNVEWVAIEAAGRARVLVAPTVQVGVSTNHLGFAGTISLRPRTLIAIITDMVETLAAHGFTQVLLLNGHGGNYASMLVAAEELRAGHPGLQVAFTDIVNLATDVGRRLSDIEYHADEVETSMSMVVAPHLVQPSRAVREITETFQTYYRRYYSGAGEMNGIVSYGVPPTRYLSQSGVMGDATVASPELGRQVAEAMVEQLVEVIADMRAAAAPQGGRGDRV